MPTPPVKYPKSRRSQSKPPIRKEEGNGGAPTPANDQNWRGIILLSVTLLVLILLYYAMIHPSMVQEEITQTKLFQLIRAHKVDSIVNEVDPSTNQHVFTGTFRHQLVQNGPEVEGAFKVPVDLSLNPDLAKDIAANGYTNIIETQSSNNWAWPLILNLLPIAIFVGLE